MNTETQKAKEYAYDRDPMADMSMWTFTIILIFRKPINTMFVKVISRAYERGFINSVQMHDILGIWNRMNGQ